LAFASLHPNLAARGNSMVKKELSETSDFMAGTINPQHTATEFFEICKTQAKLLLRRLNHGKGIRVSKGNLIRLAKARPGVDL